MPYAIRWNGRETTTVEENLQATDAWLDAYNRRNWDAFSAFLDNSVRAFEPGRVDGYRGKDALLTSYRSVLLGFPDAQQRKIRAVGQGDWVCVETEAVGTHTGPLPLGGDKTLPPTHRAVRIPIATLLRWKEGRITEFREYFDRMEMMDQLGSAP